MQNLCLKPFSTFKETLWSYLKGTRSPFELCDLDGVILDFVHELFLKFVQKDDNDDTRLTTANYIQ